MIVEIIKEHVNGLAVGLVHDFTQNVAIKLIRDGYAVESTMEQLVEYRKAANEIISARSRLMKQRIEDNILEKEKEASEKKKSDADAKHAVSDEEIEKEKAKSFEAGKLVGYENGHSVGHAEGYKLGYDACLAEMANNIFPEPENTGSQADIEPVITDNEPTTEQAEPEKPKRGRPAKAE